MRHRTLIGCTTLLFACQSGPLYPEGPMPDFTLIDINPGSPTYEQDVSPRDQLGTISAWYFGHGT